MGSGTSAVWAADERAEGSNALFMTPPCLRQGDNRFDFTDPDANAAAKAIRREGATVGRALDHVVRQAQSGRRYLEREERLHRDRRRSQWGGNADWFFGHIWLRGATRPLNGRVRSMPLKVGSKTASSA